MAKERKKHTAEFKRDAVRMMRNRGTRTVAQVADDLGVNQNQLHRWAKQLEQEGTAARNEQGETLEQENRRLRKENERLGADRQALPGVAHVGWGGRSLVTTSQTAAG